MEGVVVVWAFLEALLADFVRFPASYYLPCSFIYISVQNVSGSAGASRPLHVLGWSLLYPEGKRALEACPRPWQLLS